MIFQLSEDLIFPDPHLGEPDGLLAIDGDLSVDRLLLAYCHGIFPWYAYQQGQIHWYCPMQRFVIFPSEIHVSHSMRTLLNKRVFRASINRAFDDVIHHCAQVNNRNQMAGAWLGEDMIKAYTRLHELGYCASVEIWKDNELVGGLYGVTINRCFIGESMFSLIPSGSKIALIFLSNFMRDRGLTLIDCQFETPHLKSMGGRYIPYEEYMKYIKDEVDI